MAKFRNTHVDFVIDVRSRIEYWLGHLPTALNIPVQKLPEGLDRHPTVSKKARILVYCASGARSAIAAGTLRSHGFSNVVDGGGMAEARALFDPDA